MIKIYSRMSHIEAQKALPPKYTRALKELAFYTGLDFLIPDSTEHCNSSFDNSLLGSCNSGLPEQSTFRPPKVDNEYGESVKARFNLGQRTPDRKPTDQSKIVIRKKGSQASQRTWDLR